MFVCCGMIKKLNFYKKFASMETIESFGNCKCGVVTIYFEDGEDFCFGHFRWNHGKAMY